MPARLQVHEDRGRRRRTHLRTLIRLSLAPIRACISVCVRSAKAKERVLLDRRRRSSLERSKQRARKVVARPRRPVLISRRKPGAQHFCQESIWVNPMMRRRRRFITMFLLVNRRFCPVTAACCEAGGRRATAGAARKGRYPLCVLHLQLDLELVDVNVHPAKARSADCQCRCGVFGGAARDS